MRLRELFPRTSRDRLARLLGRTPESVARRARQVFARERVVGAWTPAEDRLLCEALGVHDLDTMALIVARAPEDVEERLRVLAGRRRSGTWSGDELAVLKRLHGTRSTTILATALGRAPEDVESMASALCLGKDKAIDSHEPQRMPRWTADEVARLRELYPTRDNLEIARLLGRSVLSVANKASQLGLGKAPAALRRMGRRNVARRRG